MKISYQILCKNEDESLEKLINLLLNHVDLNDEINICRDLLGENPKTKQILTKYSKTERVNVYEREITHTIHNQKNWLATKANGDYLFYLDADELLDPAFLQNLKPILENNSNIDTYFLPRTNIVIGLTEEYRQSRGWNVDEKGRIN